MTTLLIVDDSNYNRRLVKKMLSEDHYQVIEASNGQIALNMLAQHVVDCIILDLMMPVMDGFHLLEALNERDNRIPIIVITADIQNDTAQQCLAMGVGLVLHKPIKTEEIRAAVTHVLQGAT